MTCKYYLTLLLAGLLSLPAMASEIHMWKFNGSDYAVSEQGDKTSVVVTRKLELSVKQIKALCRKGLGLSLRQTYEDKLIEKKIVPERFSTWPITNLSYELVDIQFSDFSKTQATCTGTIKDTGYKTNLQTTALNYAIAYYTTGQYSNIKPILPLLIKEPSVAMDAAGLIVLLLSQKSDDQAILYYQQHIDISHIQSDDIKLWLAQWQQRLGELNESLLIAKSCSSRGCQNLAMGIEDELFKQQEESADDLSSYF